VEGIDGVRRVVFNHFKNRFKALVDVRPSFDELSFKVISNEERLSLTNTFFE